MAGRTNSSWQYLTDFLNKNLKELLLCIIGKLNLLKEQDSSSLIYKRSPRFLQ